MAAGRRVGQKINPRDERGWMIPREGTIRRKIYDLMVQGKRGKAIWATIGISHASFVTHRQCILQSERLNAQRYNAAHDVPVSLPVTVEYQRGWDDAMEATKTKMD